MKQRTRKIRTYIAKESSDKRFVAAVQGAEKHVIHIFDPKISNIYIGEKICHLSSWCEDLHILQSEDTTIMPEKLQRTQKIRKEAYKTIYIKLIKIM